MLLKDETFVVPTVGGDLNMYNAVYSKETDRYVYIRGDSCFAYQADDVLTEDISIALNEGGRVVETTYQTLMSGEDIKIHKILSDQEISESVKHIEMITSRDDDELWENKISDPYDWDFIRFIIKHRPDLMI